ncbi:MAG: UvrB/UvrC motif-containing protein [Candidatus Pacebacteria bacterium]|nr:UvrB/UvrC motif-containing protein [Candidatus Paceibacterota bacterium]
MKSQDLTKLKLPDTSGVYFFKKGKDILYVGKATSLRERTKSYFAKDLIETRGPLILDMVFKADSVTFEKTDSVLEALILEANLIKRHQPYYNTKEKDDKSFNYVCITKELLPKVLVIRGKDIDFKNLTSKIINLESTFGPFTSGLQLKEALKIVRRIFPFVDASSAKSDNYEFYRQLGLTPDVSNADAHIAYKKNLKNIKLFFQGKKKDILKDLQKEMKLSAKAQKFEEASRIRNQIFALEHINDIALLKTESRFKNQDSRIRIEAYDVAHMSGKNMVGVMTVIEDGEVNKREYRTFNIKGQTGADDTRALEEILSRRFRHTEWGMPSLVVADGGEAQLRVAKQVLKRYQLEIGAVSVVKDERHKPKDILGDEAMAKKYKKEILLANSEAHRFSLKLHKNKRDKNFLR